MRKRAPAAVASVRMVKSEATVPAKVRLRLVGSSNGCRSFAVNVGGRRLKCYECLNPARAKLVQRLSATLRSAGIAMPDCYGVRGNLVVAEWVCGTSLDQLHDTDKIGLMAAYQAQIHGAAAPAGSARLGMMPHVRWLVERIRGFGRGLVDDRFVARLLTRVLAARPAKAAWGVLHPDFIPDNLVVTPQGLVSVDNEFLCVGYGQEWDILNTVRVSFPDRPRLQDRYMAAYASHRSLHTLTTHPEFWEATYDLKMAGKRLSERRVDEGLRHLRSAAEKV